MTILELLTNVMARKKRPKQPEESSPFKVSTRATKSAPMELEPDYLMPPANHSIRTAPRIPRPTPGPPPASPPARVVIDSVVEAVHNRWKQSKK